MNDAETIVHLEAALAECTESRDRFRKLYVEVGAELDQANKRIAVLEAELKRGTAALDEMVATAKEHLKELASR